MFRHTSCFARSCLNCHGVPVSWCPIAQVLQCPNAPVSLSMGGRRNTRGGGRRNALGGWRNAQFLGQTHGHTEVHIEVVPTKKLVIEI